MQPVRTEALSIFPAMTSELPIVTELAHRIWPVAYKDVLTETQITNLLERIYCVENLTREMQGGHAFWIAYEGSKPIAFLSAYKEQQTIWIKKIYVDPASQGSGVGRQLLDTAQASFRPAKELRLLVNTNNLAAQRFYTHMGFTHAGEMPVQMGDYHFTDFVFSKPLTPHS